MVTKAILLIVLAAQEPAAPIAATLVEIPGGAKKPPAFLCEGTTRLPDGAIFKVNLYYGPPRPGEEKDRALVQVKDGKFSREFKLFGPRPRNLAGSYAVRIEFDPILQAPKLQAHAAARAEATIRVGDPLEEERERAAFRSQLAGEIRAILALADEVQARFAEFKGKPDPKVWDPLHDAWKERCLAIERRVGLVPEYRFLGFHTIIEVGFETLRDIFFNFVDCGGKGLAEPMKEGRIVLDRSAQQILGELTAQTLSPRQLRELVEEARKVAREAPGLPGDALSGARRRYVAITLSLGRQLGEKHHDALGGLADAGARLFDALDQQKAAEAREVQADLLARFEKLLEAIPDSP